MSSLGMPLVSVASSVSSSVSVEVEVASELEPSVLVSVLVAALVLVASLPLPSTIGVLVSGVHPYEANSASIQAPARKRSR